MIYALIFFFVGLYLIFWSSSSLIRASLHLGKLLNWSDLTIGFLVIGLGTSVPEIAISFYAAFTHQGGMVIGNITGSCITNCLLIMGVGLLFAKIRTQHASWMHYAVLLVVTLSLVYAFHVFSVSRLTAAVMLILGLAGSILLLIKDKPSATEDEAAKVLGSKLKSSLAVLYSLFFVILSAKLITESGMYLAEKWGMNNGAFALLFIAIGTSLPELVLAIMAARKGHVNLLVGNVVGSNICNVAFGVGLPAVIWPFVFDLSNAVMISAVLLVSTLLFMGASYCKMPLQRFVGAVLVIAYCLAYALMLK